MSVYGWITEAITVPRTTKKSKIKAKNFIFQCHHVACWLSLSVHLAPSNAGSYFPKQWAVGWVEYCIYFKENFSRFLRLSQIGGSVDYCGSGSLFVYVIS
jgi:hypothetical protein